MDASSLPAGRTETVETMDSFQGGAVDASSVPAGRAESDSGASAASGTDQWDGEDPPAVELGRAAHDLSSCGRLPPTVMGWAWVQIQRQQDESAQYQRAIKDAMSAAVQMSKVIRFFFRRCTSFNFVRDSGLDLTAYTHDDYADKSNDRCSVSGTVTTLGGAAVSWASNTRRCVKLSTSEARHVALGEVAKEALFTGAV